DDRAVVLAWIDVVVDPHGPAAVEAITQQRKHAFAHRLVVISAQLEAERVVGPTDELHDDLDVELIAGRTVAGADVVHAQQAQLSTQVQRHGILLQSRAITRMIGAVRQPLRMNSMRTRAARSNPSRSKASLPWAAARASSLRNWKPKAFSGWLSSHTITSASSWSSGGP